MDLYGLIGYPLSHSFSEKFFTEKFRKEGIGGAEYKLFPIENVDETRKLLKLYPYLRGLNVTIPYKESIIPLLDDIDPVARTIGSVNCLKIVENNLRGYNTDYLGFAHCLRHLLNDNTRKTLVLGSGGSAKAVAYVLERLGMAHNTVSRTKTGDALDYTELDEEIMGSHQLIVNTTPLGMFPKTDACPPVPYHLLTPEHICFDLVYNPAKTLFLEKAEKQGASIQNGYDMLVRQAEESWRIWRD